MIHILQEHHKGGTIPYRGGHRTSVTWGGHVGLWQFSILHPCEKATHLFVTFPYIWHTTVALWSSVTNRYLTSVCTLGVLAHLDDGRLPDVKHVYIARYMYTARYMFISSDTCISPDTCIYRQIHVYCDMYIGVGLCWPQRAR